MKAAVLEKRGREGLLLRDVAMPTRRPGEVLLRVHAAGLNRVDLYMHDNGSGITHSLPQTMGVEAAGDSGRAARGVGEPTVAGCNQRRRTRNRCPRDGSRR